MTDIFYYLFILAVYFFPAYAAFKRRHKNFLPIFLLTLFTAWTLIGWLAALIWACTSNTHKGESPA
jgi:hypothetical protein